MNAAAPPRQVRGAVRCEYGARAGRMWADRVHEEAGTVQCAEGVFPGSRAADVALAANVRNSFAAR